MFPVSSFKSREFQATRRTSTAAARGERETIDGLNLETENFGPPPPRPAYGGLRELDPAP